VNCNTTRTLGFWLESWGLKFRNCKSEKAGAKKQIYVANCEIPAFVNQTKMTDQENDKKNRGDTVALNAKKLTTNAAAAAVAK
jgi:hypothetical protein